MKILLLVALILLTAISSVACTSDERLEDSDRIRLPAMGSLDAVVIHDRETGMTYRSSNYIIWESKIRFEDSDGVVRMLVGNWMLVEDK